jgi:hypothetical protein
MSEMVRKQIYISRRQPAMIKRLAEARGLSEAEVIRQAIDREASHATTPQSGRGSQAAWEGAYAVMLYLLSDAGKFTEPIRRNREDVYAERPGRYQILDKPDPEDSSQG